MMYYERFENMPDEEAVALAQSGDGAALEHLLNKYKNFVRTKARSYFLIGADHEDIVQEGMIGLYKAIRDFKPEKLTSFRAFAELCVTRQIITAIKTATRQKHIPLNSYVSLNKPIYDEESDRTLLDVISEDVPSDPEAMLIDREDPVSYTHLDVYKRQAWARCLCRWGPLRSGRRSIFLRRSPSSTRCFLPMISGCSTRKRTCFCACCPSSSLPTLPARLPHAPWRISVSYTHLDVYKRQIERFRAGGGVAAGLPVGPGRGAAGRGDVLGNRRADRRACGAGYVFGPVVCRRGLRRARAHRRVAPRLGSVSYTHLDVYKRQPIQPAHGHVARQHGLGLSLHARCV